MRKGVVVFVSVLLMAAFVPRPAEAEVSFDLGIKAGVTMSNIKWSDDDGSEKALYRPTFGVFALIRLSPTLDLQPEINYMTVGESWAWTEDSSSFKVVETYNYLHIPLLFKLRLAKQGRVVPIVFAGPALGVLLSAHDKYYVNGELDDDYDAKEYHKSVDFGLDIGAQAEMMMDKLKLILDLRYYLGLANTYRYETYTMKTNAVMLTAGVAF